MASSAITLEVLPAAYGDCLLVTCPVGRSTWRLLVDTGPDETYPALRRRLLQLPQGADGRRHIDLFVVTHIDHDHIGGAKLLLDDKALGLAFGDIWFNAPPTRRPRGVAEGQSLAEILGAQDRALPWNAVWSGQPVSTPADGGSVEIAGTGRPRITVVSPTPDRLKDLYKVWQKELDRLRRNEPEVVEPERGTARGASPDIEALAARVTPTDSAVPNGSSIAMLLEHKGASVLLCGDAFPTVLTHSLTELARHRGLAGPLRVDAVKLSHHGSRANVTRDFLKAVDAEHFVFSTNNRSTHHPNPEAVARVINGAKNSTLWFNYDTPVNRQWGEQALMEKYGYRARFPAQGEAGVTLALPTRRKPRAT